MKTLFSIFRNILLWTYGRGSWQYDLMCLLILAFIFLTPPSFFKENRSYHPKQLQGTATATAPLSAVPSGNPSDTTGTETTLKESSPNTTVHP